MKELRKILVANRGEIACRVMRTAEKMGIETVAVYSDVDRSAKHVQMADEAYHIGPPPSNESYLRMDKIIDVAKTAGAHAIHPGYGFLSENAAFAQKVHDAGLIFIGPSPHSIRTMGSKLAAKEAVKQYDIPMVPGAEEAITDIKKAKEMADDIGYPILIKASAGGGGKGMRIVENAKDFEDQMKRAISEAQSAFGDGSVFIEKYITQPKHIEIQILGDQHGNYVHLFERECSIQRRHQKVIEEAPSAFVNDELRQRMGEAAIYVAKSCQYEGAGTVEFLMDADHNFYFLEMNTRLQVEHPITEWITGLDLVEWQFRIARGDVMSLEQSNIKRNGHAIELRVSAEDPDNNFLPSIGRLEKYEVPTGPYIRVDDGYEENHEIPIFYDPLVSKLTAWGLNRLQAIERLKYAIQHYKIEGIKTTLPFGLYVLNHPKFISGRYSTHFVQDHFFSGKEENHANMREGLAALGLRIYKDEISKIT